MTSLTCAACGESWPLAPMLFGCPNCVEHALEVRYDTNAIEDSITALGNARRESIWDYSALLPVPDTAARITLGEGWTPLVAAPALADASDTGQVLVKFEASNPTGAFKDRLNAVNVSVARAFGYQRVLCSTTGNHGVSLAAYAAAGRLECLVACQPDVEPVAVQQMRLHGARVVVFDGPPSEGRALLGRMVRDEGWFPSVRNHPRPYANPFGLEGYKTIAFEVWHQLGRLPDWVLVPTGGGDSLAGIARGFRELRQLGMTDRLPRLAACQASASAPLVQAWTARLPSVPTLRPASSAAISVLEDRTGDHALHVLADGDIALALNEAQIRTAVTILGRDGLCAEPASAVAAAGLMELKRLGRIDRDEVAVCIATASGVRWPATFAGLDGRPEQLGTG